MQTQFGKKRRDEWPKVCLSLSCSPRYVTCSYPYLSFFCRLPPPSLLLAGLGKSSRIVAPYTCSILRTPAPPTGLGRSTSLLLGKYLSKPELSDVVKPSKSDLHFFEHFFNLHGPFLSHPVPGMEPGRSLCRQHLVLTLGAVPSWSSFFTLKISCFTASFLICKVDNF